MSEPLKPCPFCAGPALKWKRWGEKMACCKDTTCPGHGVQCNVDDWNTRVPDATLSAEVERLRGERDANHNLAIANGSRAKEEEARAEAAEARVAELISERDKARRYCSVSAYDMAGFAETLKANPDAFPRSTHDLRFPQGWLAQQMAISIDALADISATYSRAGTPYTVSVGDIARYRRNLSDAIASGALSHTEEA